MGKHVFIHFKWGLFEFLNFRVWASLMSWTLANWASFGLCTWFQKEIQMVWLPNKAKQRTSSFGDNFLPGLMSGYLRLLFLSICSRLQSPKSGAALGFSQPNRITVLNTCTSILCPFQSLLASWWSNRLQNKPTFTWSDHARQTRLVAFLVTNWHVGFPSLEAPLIASSDNVFSSLESSSPKFWVLSPNVSPNDASLSSNVVTGSSPTVNNQFVCGWASSNWRLMDEMVVVLNVLQFNH